MELSVEQELLSLLLLLPLLELERPEVFSHSTCKLVSTWQLPLSQAAHGEIKFSTFSGISAGTKAKCLAHTHSSAACAA